MIPPPRWWARERSRRRSLCRRRRCLSFLLFFSSVVWSSKRLPFSCARSSSREIAVLYLCLKMMSTTMCAKREASKSSSLLLLLLLSRKSRVSFEGKTRVVVVSPQKSRSSFRDFGGRGLSSPVFCREMCTLIIRGVSNNNFLKCVKNVSSFSSHYKKKHHIFYQKSRFPLVCFQHGSSSSSSSR